MNRLLLVSLVASLLVLPSAFAGPVEDAAAAAAAANTALTDMASATTAAEGNAPTDSASKTVEDALDAAARNTEDAAQTNADVQADQKSTDAMKEKAQENEKTARDSEEEARSAADTAKASARNPTRNENYRKALERRRAARAQLKRAKKLLEDSLRLLRGARRTESDPSLPRNLGSLLKRVNGALDSATAVPVALIEPREQGTGLAALTAGNRLKMVLAGTGETIGRIATLTLTNPGDKPVTAKIPPLLLISRSGKSQHYAAPFAQSVSIAPGKSRVVPLEGVCITRSKPPVAKGQSGELIAQDAEGQQATGPKTQGQAEGPAISAAQTAKVLKATAAYYQAAQKLEKQGAYKKMPYSQPKKQQEIAVQWGVWRDPEIAKITGEKPAAKADLAKTIYKQAEEQGPVAPETKQKLDQGIDEIFESIELTGKEAKAIEKSPAA